MRLATKLGLLVMLSSAAAFGQTTIYFKTTDPGVSGYNCSITETRGAGGAATAAATTLTSSGTLIQATDSAGGTALSCISNPFASGVTLSSAMTINVWAKEAGSNNNTGVSVRLYKYSGGVEGSVFATCVFGTELTTTMAAKNYACTPTSTAFSTGDRLVAKVYFVNCTTSGCPTGTMGAGTGTWDYNRSSAADGESFVTLGNTSTFNNNVDYTLTPAPTMGITALADLTAQFDLLTALSSSATAGLTVSSFTCSGVCAAGTDFPLAPSMGVTVAATVSQGIGQTPSASASIANTAKNAIAQTITNTVTAAATSAYGTGETSTIAVTASATGKNGIAQTIAQTSTATLTAAQGTTESASLAVTGAATVSAFNQASGSTDYPLSPTAAVTAAATAQHGISEGTTASVTAGSTVKYGTSQAPAIAVTAASTPSFLAAFGIAPTIAFTAAGTLDFETEGSLAEELVTASMDVTQFDKVTGLQNYSMTPSADATSLATTQLGTAEFASATPGTSLTTAMGSGNGASATSSTNLTASFVAAYHFGLSFSVTPEMLITAFDKTAPGEFNMSPPITATLTIPTALQSTNSQSASASAGMSAEFSAGHSVPASADATASLVVGMETSQSATMSSAVVVSASFSVVHIGDRRRVVFM